MASSKKKSVVKKTPAKTAKTSTKAPAKRGTKKASAADQVDEQLARYRSMRDFGITEEPSGKSSKKSAKSTALPFVIQKHAASHLHYDFRLGWNGVLKSWAVAKGPSYFTKDRRLAVQVEDHPMEYGGFEGIIPKGQYGGGTVMVWDQGTWEPHVDVDEGLKSGSLKFAMKGKKMKGNWTLVRMHNMSGNKPNWLLIKEHDEFERGEHDPPITEEKPNSAITGRSLEEIASAETHIWESNRTSSSSRAWHRKEDGDKEQESKAPTPTADLTSLLKGLPKERLPAFIPPQLASHVDAPPTEGEWLHELKLDGYRIQARKHGNEVQLLTRTGLDWTHRMRPVAEAIREVNAADALLDGEVVVLDAEGNSSFAKLQASFEQGEKHPFTYFAFDLLHCNGFNTRNLPLSRRKQILAAILPRDSSILRLNEHIDGEGLTVFHHACELHAEGIISKRAQSHYTSGRNANWTKSKCVREQEFVLGGFTLPTNGSYGIGSLLLGYYRDGKLIYAGRTGTGFTQKIHRILRDKLEALRVKVPAFDSIPATAKRDANWIKPNLVVQVRFATWTADDLVRQASYLGLREDKPAKDVRREEASEPPKPKAARSASLSPKKPATAVKVASRKTTTAILEAPPVRLTHPEKILDETTGVTKQELANYYWAIAKHMLPHIAGRPLSLVRCPEGSGKPCFFQKHTNHMLPPGIGSVMVPDKKTGVPEPYITLDTPEALAGLAQMGVLEVHPWGSTNKDLEHPDRIIIDLDPDEAISWRTLADSAKSVRKGLKALGLESFLKTTGGKGLHVVLPIKPDHDWSAAKEWAHTFALGMEALQPQLYLTKMTKAARKGKIYVDYLRNERGATAVAPFSPRARAGAPVSVPLAWSELDADERPSFRIHDFDKWKSRLHSDPWKKMSTLRQQLPNLDAPVRRSS
jgi:bifunctional non-homologous end joining protein LigD